MQPALDHPRHQIARAPDPLQPAPAAPPARAMPQAPTVPAGRADDLKRIKLIDAGLEASLNRLGITRYEQIAAWLQADVKRLAAQRSLKRGRVRLIG